MHERQAVDKTAKALQDPISEVEIWRAVCEIIAGFSVFKTLKRRFEITLLPDGGGCPRYLLGCMTQLF